MFKNLVETSLPFLNFVKVVSYFQKYFGLVKQQICKFWSENGTILAFGWFQFIFVISVEVSNKFVEGGIFSQNK